MIEQAIKQILEDTVASLWPSISKPDFAVEHPKNPDHGDYASNIAMVLTKLAKEPPRQIAQKITENLKDPNKVIESASIAGPGFINFVITNQALQQTIPEVLAQGDNYGQHEDNGQKVLLEFVSVNPTGPLHLGHARAAFLGDAIAGLLKTAGYQVTREFYINDAGNQVKTLGESVYARYCQLFGQEINLAKDAYPAEYVIDIAKTLKEEDGDKWLTRDDYLPRCIQIGIDENLKSIKQVLKDAGIEFDSWYSEKSLYDRGIVQKLIQTYRDKNLLYEASQAAGTENKVRREESKAAKHADKQTGGTFLKTSEFGDEEDRILLRKDGTPVYLTADVAYHEEKFNRGFDWLINIVGADHGGHVPRMHACIKALGIDDSKLEYLLLQMVRLIKDGKELKFSKRSGQLIELQEFIDDVGLDVARVIFLMRSHHTQFDFDLGLALKQSADNPVYYLQYGHARMATLLKKAQESGHPGLDPGSSATGPRLKEPAPDLIRGRGDILARLTLPEERNMLKKMAAYPEVILSAAKTLEPHRIIFYAHDLIAEFHSYFTKYRHTEKIISEDQELTQARLMLVAAMKQVLYNTLRLMGLTAPESMHHD